jgi:ubiquinone/menaquinone biosynthesis C-methylase UbiE
MGILKMSRAPNSQYNVAATESLPVRIATKQRRRMFFIFVEKCEIRDNDTVLDVGVTSDQSYESSNYVEAWLPKKSRITAVGIDDAAFLEDLYPGLKFIKANGLDFPFEDKSFNVVHCSAVLEHVGSFENQVKLIAECARVSKDSFFLTTPNRFLPMEFHTVLPLVHWLPKPWFRQIMKKTGREFFASEANLNLMSISELRKATTLELQDSNFEFKVISVRLLGCTSNFLLHGKRVLKEAQGGCDERL